MRHRGLIYDLSIALLLFGLAVALFWPVALGDRTLLPADMLFGEEPWLSYAPAAQIPLANSRARASTYLQDYASIRFAVDSLRLRQIPLWNPYILCGIPFLASGQHGLLYPLSLIYYILPLPISLGWFALLHVFLAGVFCYMFTRSLGMHRMGSALAALCFQFGGFIILGNESPMRVAAAVWLPLVLACIERVVSRAICREARLTSHLPAVALGATAPRTRIAVRPLVPNPSADGVRVALELDTNATIRLEVYDIRGRRVSGPSDYPLAPGQREIHWNGLAGGRPLAAGTYILRLRGPSLEVTQKVLLLRDRP